MKGCCKQMYVSNLILGCILQLHLGHKRPGASAACFFFLFFFFQNPTLTVQHSRVTYQTMVLPGSPCCIVKFINIVMQYRCYPHLICKYFQIFLDSVSPTINLQIDVVYVIRCSHILENCTNNLSRRINHCYPPSKFRPP